MFSAVFVYLFTFIIFIIKLHINSLFYQPAFSGVLHPLDFLAEVIRPVDDLHSQVSYTASFYNPSLGAPVDDLHSQVSYTRSSSEWSCSCPVNVLYFQVSYTWPMMYDNLSTPVNVLHFQVSYTSLTVHCRSTTPVNVLHFQVSYTQHRSGSGPRSLSMSYISRCLTPHNV